MARSNYLGTLITQPSQKLLGEHSAQQYYK